MKIFLKMNMVCLKIRHHVFGVFLLKNLIQYIASIYIFVILVIYASKLFDVVNTKNYQFK